MILNCPECQTRYAVPDSAIGVEGRRVRCVQCRHEWFQEGTERALTDAEDILNPALAAPNPDVEIPDWSSLPALNKSGKFAGSNLPWQIASAVALLLLLAGVMLNARESLYSAAPGLYRALGYYPTDGVQLANVKIEATEGRRKKIYALDCLIANQAAEPRIRPPVAMRILTGTGSVLAEDDAYIAGGKMMLAGDKADCGKMELANHFSSAEYLMLEIGSPLDLARRGGAKPDHHLAEEAPAEEIVKEEIPEAHSPQVHEEKANGH